MTLLAVVALAVLGAHLIGVIACACVLHVGHRWSWPPALLVGCAWPVILPLAVWEWVGGRRI